MAIHNTMCYVMVVIFALILHSPTNIEGYVCPTAPFSLPGICPDPIVPVPPSVDETMVEHQARENKEIIPIPCELGNDECLQSM